MIENPPARVSVCLYETADRETAMPTWFVAKTDALLHGLKNRSVYQIREHMMPLTSDNVVDLLNSQTPKDNHKGTDVFNTGEARPVLASARPTDDGDRVL